MKAEISFDSVLFSIEAVKAACYRLLDRFSPEIELKDGKIVCHLTFDEGVSPAAAELLISNLRKEVLDQDLRLRLKTETEPVRNLILAHAFSKTGLIGDE